VLELGDMHDPHALSTLAVVSTATSSFYELRSDSGGDWILWTTVGRRFFFQRKHDDEGLRTRDRDPKNFGTGSLIMLLLLSTAGRDIKLPLGSIEAYY